MNSFFPITRYKRLNPDAPDPKYAYDGDAGFDLYAMETVEIAPQGMVKVGCGLAFAIPRGFYGALVPRSSMATERGITLINTPATIDSKYRGEVIMPLYNASTETQIVEKGERVCQMIVQPYGEANLVEVDELDETERGVKGFGSSGYERL